MCVLAYEGLQCGHAGLGDASFKVEGCANEATCDSITYQVLCLGQRDHEGRRRCAGCRAILLDLSSAWEAERDRLESIGVPESACQHVGESILAAFKERRKARIAIEGPENRAPDEFGALQAEFIREVRAFADRLHRADEDWDEHLTVIEEFGGPWDGNPDDARKHGELVAEIFDRREEVRASLTAKRWDAFLNGQQDALDSLYRRILRSDLPARGDPSLI